MSVSDRTLWQISFVLTGPGLLSPRLYTNVNNAAHSLTRLTGFYLWVELPSSFSKNINVLNLPVCESLGKHAAVNCMSN